MTASTIIKASPCSLTWRLIASRSLMTPVEVSLWVIMTALISLLVSAWSLVANWAGSKGCPHSAVTVSTFKPKAWPTSTQRSPNLPLEPTKIRSPGERKLIIPASTAPVPLTFNINTSLAVWCSHLRFSVTSAIMLLNSPLRWPMGCLANASKAASGTGVGPGIISINLSSMFVCVLVENFNTIQINRYRG